MATAANGGKWSDLTDYPDIFKNVYWGQLMTADDHPGEDIIDARNCFITIHGVTAQTKVTEEVICQLGEFRKNKYARFLDHQECYETESEIILIASPFVKSNEQGLIDFCGQAEFETIDNMYMDGETTTIMRKFRKPIKVDQSKMSDECPAEQWADLTDYPELYRGTYWGTHATSNNSHPGASVIAARNNFVRRYGVIDRASWTKKASIELSPLFQYDENGIKIWDHSEAYVTSDKLIAIASPYRREKIDRKIVDLCEYKGFAVIPNMYMAGATTTIMKTFPKASPEELAEAEEIWRYQKAHIEKILAEEERRERLLAELRRDYEENLRKLYSVSQEEKQGCCVQ